MPDKFHQYKNPSLAVDLVVFGYQERQLSVLLLNRNESPFKGQWTLPGGFLQMDETLLQVCARVLKTKMGVGNLYLEQLSAFDDPARDPRGRVISIAHYALINPKRIKLAANKMANDVQWFAIDNIPKLGFDHRYVLNKAVEKLKAKILNQPVGFELLDETFTMTELHDLYECILGVVLDRRNFRRKILDASYVTATGTKREGLKNRHPDLYRFNKKIKESNFQLNIPS